MTVDMENYGPPALAQRANRLLGWQHELAVAIAKGTAGSGESFLADLRGSYALAQLYWKEIERRSIDRHGLWTFGS